MPEYILPHGDAKSEGEFNSLPDFVRGYIEAMFFTDNAEGVSSDEWAETEAEREAGTIGGSFPNDCTPDDLAPCALASIMADCEAFQKKAGAILAEAIEREGYSEEQAGRDFWFTRNGHGVGFWDREELDAGGAGDALSELCRYSEVNPYFNAEDGKIYL